MIIGVDPRAHGYKEAEHAGLTLPGVLGLPPGTLDEVVVSTHFVGVQERVTAVAVSVPDAVAARLPQPRDLAARVLDALPHGGAVVVTGGGSPDATEVGDAAHLPVAWGAALQAATRSAGRLVHVRGLAALRGTFPVGEVVRRAAVDEVHVVGGLPMDPAAPFHTFDYVRPVWRDGVTVLVVQGYGQGGFSAFEVEHPIPCCADHALT